MKARMPDSAVRRSSLPLTERNELELAELRGSEPHRKMLAELSEVSSFPADASEAVLLHSLFEIGLKAVRDGLELQGYGQLAAEQLATAEQSRSFARRRRPSWADEA